MERDLDAAVSKTTEGVHLCTYLEASAGRFPQRLAVRDSDGAALTYEELNQRADRVAGFLVNHGVKPGDRVGLVLPKTSMAFAAVFGVMKARAAYVPVDWTGPAERTRAILTSCQVRVALVDPRCPDLEGTAEVVVPLDAAAWDTILQYAPLESDPTARRADDIAYILYTSGSTGVPKGVMVTQHNATSYVDWCAELLSACGEDRFGNHAPFHFAMCILDIFVPIREGGSVHLVGEELGKNPKDLARFIADRKLTVWYSTPAILGLLAEFGNLSRLDCSSLRVVLFAGEPFPIKKLRRIQELWPAPAYYNLWGSTETNACTYALIPKPIPEDRVEPYPIGRAGSHCSIMVLDDDARPVAPGEAGLMYIAGPPVFQGYWGRETVFLERDGAKWHNTGDVVKEQEGEGLVYVGRRDRMVKRRGFRIELAEVEGALYQHPAMSEAAAIALPDVESGTRIIAYLVAPEEPRPSIVEMKAFCNQHLPAYMNPDVFVFTEALPRTRSNKVDYQALIHKPL
jgi:amino acid adenylation domain-containing protein